MNVYSSPFVAKPESDASQIQGRTFKAIEVCKQASQGPIFNAAKAQVTHWSGHSMDGAAPWCIWWPQRCHQTSFSEFGHLTEASCCPPDAQRSHSPRLPAVPLCKSSCGLHPCIRGSQQQAFVISDEKSVLLSRRPSVMAQCGLCQHICRIEPASALFLC